MRIFISIITGLSMIVASGVCAADVAFGGLSHQSDTPVEVNANALSVNQSTGLVTFDGDVTAIQGGLRLAADTVVVAYGTAESASKITSMVATGNVLFVTPEDEAKSNKAVYDLQKGVIEMTGNVLLTQGPAVVSADTMFVNLDTGAATLSGNVRTTLQPNSATE